MEIQTPTGTPGCTKDLVLYMDFSVHPQSRNITGFMATIYQGIAETTSSYQGEIFHSSGEGYTEWTLALTFADLLLHRTTETTLRTQMETWLHALQVSSADTFRLRCQIRYKRHASDIRFARDRLVLDGNRYIQRSPSTVVLAAYSENQIKTDLIQ